MEYCAAAVARKCYINTYSKDINHHVQPQLTTEEVEQDMSSGQ